MNSSQLSSSLFKIFHQFNILENAPSQDLNTEPHLLTSSADCAMKNPTVFEGNFVPLGLMEILLSFPSSLLTSMASNKSLSFTKHNLNFKKTFRNIQLFRPTVIPVI